jgi:hypothetical protein
MNDNDSTQRVSRYGPRHAAFVTSAALPSLLAAVTAAMAPSAASGQDFGCSASARLLRFACAADLRDDFFTATAQCIDAATPDDACHDAAEVALDEGRDECDEVFSARMELCEALDDETHEPDFGIDFVANFVDPTQIGAGVAPNPYFPLVAGNRWVYADEEETITVEVTDETKLIDGIRCVTVTDIVTEDGVLIEDTDDWYAQDVNGNVWYCGEIAQNFELFDGDMPETAELVDLEGSWKHGRDGAKAGLLLPATPNVGDVIRQEVKFTDAEDVVEILSVTASETAPGGSCSGNCLQTLDFTPLEPDAEEHKYYAPGIGLIVEVKPETGERLELMEFVGVGQ